MIKFALPAVFLFLAATIGCEAPELNATATSEKAPEAPKEEEVVMVAGAPGEPLPDDAPPVTDVPRPFDLHDPIKGRRSRDAGGYLGAVGNARFAAEYKMMLISITEALNLFWAPEGEYPKSHEEFMDKIIKFNNIKLPELPESVEYIYMPDAPGVPEKLQVRLTPGSPNSKLPAPEKGKEHVYDPKAIAAAGIVVTTAEAEATGVATAPEGTATEGEAAEGEAPPAAEPATGAPGADAEDGAAVGGEPSPNIRERAAQLGAQGNAQAEGQ